MPSPEELTIAVPLSMRDLNVPEWAKGLTTLVEIQTQNLEQCSEAIRSLNESAASNLAISKGDGLLLVQALDLIGDLVRRVTVLEGGGAR